jgi:hypothetical protein
MEDFEKARGDLIDALRRAPTRRMDNQITQMQSFAERLRLHAFVIDEAAKRYRRSRVLSYTIQGLSFAALGVAAFVSGLLVALPVLAVVAVAAVPLFALVSVPLKKKRIIAQFDEIFEGLHDRELLVRDRAEDLRAMWEEVHPRAREVAEKRGLQSFSKMRRVDRDVLNELIEKDIPKLRSELYDALRDVSIDAGPQNEELPDVEELPTILVAPDGRRRFRWGRRDPD